MWFLKAKSVLAKWFLGEEEVWFANFKMARALLY
jgi:hypothetical protein